MADEGRLYKFVVTPPAQCAVAEKLPEAVAAAVIDFLTSTLTDQPHRVGTPLRDDLASVWSARRATCRVLYRTHEGRDEVIVLRIEHRLTHTARRPL